MTQENVTKLPDFQISKKAVFSIIAAVLAFFICSQLPLQAYGDKCASALGFFVAFIILMLGQPWSMLVTSMLVPIGGFYLGFWDWGTFQAATGTSTFLLVVSFTIVAMGAETTPLGKRIALTLLKYFGQKPVRMVVVFGVVTGLLSAFISNTATLVMMSSIANAMLLSMGEKAGESRLGRCLMLLIATMSFVGGSALFCGCVFGNALGLDLIKAAAGELFASFNMSFGQWAILGFPAYVVTAVPICLIYAYWMKVNKTENQITTENYSEQLEELGKIQACEIRWIITVLIMIVLLLFGANGQVIPLLFATITLMPVIGTVPVNKVMKMMPFQIFFLLYFSSILGALFTNTGLAAMITAIVTPIIPAMNPYIFSVAIFLLNAFLQNVCVNGSIAIMSLIFSVSTPLAISMGYNPFVVLFPAICASSYFFWIPLTAGMMLNKEYGWWEVKDSLVPGALTLLFLGIVVPAITLIFAPMAGLSVYL